jgi:hypothetical protein
MLSSKTIPIIYLKFSVLFSIKNRSVVEKHEQLIEDNSKQETTLSFKRSQRDAYVSVNFVLLYDFIISLGQW